MTFIAVVSNVSPQFVTTHLIANDLAKSLTVSVLPVPAGPAGAPPNLNVNAVVSVMTHLSVKGVMTNLLLRP